MTAETPTVHKRLHAVVTGRVQGVGFRASTLEVAQRLGLAGWVRNLSDGGVELEAEGPGDAVERLLAFLHTGPRMAHVAAVAVDWRPVATGQRNGAGPVVPPLPRPFELRRTF